MSSQEQAQLAPIDTCTHPKLASWQDIFTGDYCYQCMGCGKHIVIPVRSIMIEEDNKHISHAVATAAIYAKVAGIVGLAFGEQWEKKVLGEYERTRIEV